jgi:hypothetical protein
MKFAVVKVEVQVSKSGLCIGTCFGSFAESHGVGLLVRTLDVDPTVRIGVNAKRRGFRFADGALFGIQNRVVMIKANAKIGATLGREID